MPPIEDKANALARCVAENMDTEDKDVAWLFAGIGIVPDGAQKDVVKSFRRQMLSIGLNEGWDAAEKILST